jgi:hypothetical protein
MTAANQAGLKCLAISENFIDDGPPYKPIAFPICRHPDSG